MPQDYNSTIHLPKTDFPMRAGLPAREPVALEQWEKDRIYETLMEKNSGKPLFVLHDGPPYANGDIHMGHALNKILKDFIVRYKNMSGFQAPYVPGWDTHGLPIERQAIKAYGLNRDKVSTAEFRSKCKEFALKHVENQKKGFKRLGCMGEWDHPYLTLTHDFEARQIEVFGEMALKGYIYKGLKPVYWCPHDETALAEAEIEYQDEPCNSIYVKFAVKDDKGKISSVIGTTENVYFVIWTTTTWTLPANQAIALNPDFEYDFVRVPSGEIYILAKELEEAVLKVGGIDSHEVLATVMGADLEYIVCQHPFIAERESVVILGDHVTLEAGTGAVHTAPGHGLEDYQACMRYPDVIHEVIVPVDSKGYMNEYAGKFAGLYYDKTNALIVEDLKSTNSLYAVEEIAHTYPHCWRCKNPIVYRATEQWFCSVDALKDAAVEACHSIKWLPAWGEERMISMIRERSDWCISRQRVWGVPLPIFYCKDCGKELITAESIKAVADLFREKGSNAWYELEAKDILPAGTACACGCTEFTKETDIMDVWFDSGSSHAAVLDERDYLHFPADMYLEGGDQYRGWFQSSMLTSIASKGVAPYKSVLTHGWTLDEDARKMSKSLGNGVMPLDLIKDFGADVLRLWVASADYRQDMRISKEMFKHLSQNYLKIRNTARYILGNLDGFDPEKHMVAYEQMTEFDRWALMRLNDLVARVEKAYEEYEYHIVTHAIHNFCVIDMSNFYLDVIKDRLYCDEEEGLARRSAQTAIYLILDALVRIIAPILCFTADEIWKAMPHRAEDDVRAVVFNDMPKVNDAYAFDEEKAAKWDKIIAVRDDVNRALEQARAEKRIGKPLEADVTISADAAGAKFLSECGENLASLFIVSRVHVTTDDVDGLEGLSLGGIKVKIVRAEGEKCERCWIYAESVGSDAQHPHLCARCASVVKD